MNESRMPAGYVPLTVHQVGSGGNSRTQSGRGDGGHSGGSRHHGGKPMSKNSKGGSRYSKDGMRDHHKGSSGDKKRRPRTRSNKSSSE